MSKYIVRYGTMRSLGVMTARHDAKYRRSMEVIVRTDRGVEVGQVLCEATDDALSQMDRPAAGSIVRLVSDDDLQGIDQIDGARKQKLEVCQKHIDALGLDMKLVEVEALIGGERLVVYYIAEERVDFRELVRLLAGEFRTRIEMRQIGVRDEAKVLADYGDCGKPICCNTHLTTMPPVSMKMAKLQKASLDPTKISGRCGRLKCCLRYEYDNYVETRRQLPKIGVRVATRDGAVKILNHKIITEQLLVETEDHRRMVIDASEVLSVIKDAPPEPMQTSKGKSKSSHPQQGNPSNAGSNKKRKTATDASDRETASEQQAVDSNVKSPQAKALGSQPKSGGKSKKRRSNRNRRRKPDSPGKDIGAN